MGIYNNMPEWKVGTMYRFLIPDLSREALFPSL